MEFNEIILCLSKIEEYSSEEEGILTNTKFYNFYRMMYPFKHEYAKMNIIRYDIFASIFEGKDLNKILKKLFDQNILILEVDEATDEKIRRKDCGNTNNFIKELIAKKISSKGNIIISITRFNEKLVRILARKTIKDIERLEDVYQNVEGTLQTFNRDIMVIMTLFITAAGLISVNANVFDIIETYGIGRQLLTIMIANFSLIYVIFTIFVCIDHIVSFNKKSPIKEIWFNMTFLFAVLALLAFLLEAIKPGVIASL